MSLLLVPMALACGSEAPAASDEGISPLVDVPAPPAQQSVSPGVAGNGAPAPRTAIPDATTGAAPQAGAGLPCDVGAVVADNCQTCHGPTPIGGAISLVTHDDWHQPSRVDPTMLVHQMAKIRINDGSMPQGAVMAPGDLAMLDGWLAAGALAGGGPDDASCMAAPPSTGEQPVDAPEDVDYVGLTIDSCKREGAFTNGKPTPFVAEPGETCYEFAVHAPRGSGPFTVPTGESYHEWYYAVPWAPGDVWTRYGADFDNIQVLHHFLAFTSNAARSDGDVATNVTGTTLGTGATLIGGWAVGGCNTELAPEVGGVIPPSPLLMVQWHMYNTTGLPTQDASRVQICTVPAGTRPNTAGITFLGTENFNGPLGMPPGESSFTTQCTNFSGGPITVIGFNPHMHTYGTHMKTDLRRVDGTVTTIFDQPFQFDYQVGYEIPPVVVNPGDTLVSTCSFFNDSGGNVAFGESTNQEMCYQFALSYPAGALQNGAPSLIGALNTCW